MGKGRDRDGGGGKTKPKGKGKEKDHRRGNQDYISPEEAAAMAALEGREVAPPAEESSSEEEETREQFRARVKREVPAIKEEEGSDDGSGSDEDGSSDGDAAVAAMFAAQGPRVSKAPARSKQEEEVGRTKREQKDDMKRLAEIRAKREAARLARVEQDGWDKFAPITKDNHPPGYDLSLIGKK